MGKKNTEIEVLDLKRELANRYIYVLAVTFITCILIFSFYMKDPIMVYYLIGGFFSLLLPFYILGNHYDLLKVVKVFILVMPLYNLFIVFRFWNISVCSLIWIVALPFWANIFFSKKEVVIFTVYAIFLISFCCIFAGNDYFGYPFNDLKKGNLTDAFIFTVNLIQIFLGTYYKSLIQNIKSKEVIIEKKVSQPAAPVADKDLQLAENIFEKIDQEVIGNKLFRNADLTISELSSTIKVNNNYISKAIKINGFDNFNHYINTHRVVYVKNKLHSDELKTMTLMHIYSEAGFKNQSTFNKVFKKIEGVTPSEYIQKTSTKVS
ncbi:MULTISPECIES: helix-turn-helix domain-containing protein [Chryseobacterium]|uniref:helix-turn-helix domain-containing protein n=1 Tax=Chryseobacterium TaxID=59732 RepID=UPI001624A86E|nr:AraC family transcriptional regulator [Chryseobacterium sp. C3]